MISFKGIEPAVLVHGLYHATASIGMGMRHDKPTLTLEQVTAELAPLVAEARASAQPLHIDYFHGRPLKIRIDLAEERFDGRLFDRDAGAGAAVDAVSRIYLQKRLAGEVVNDPIRRAGAVLAAAASAIGSSRANDVMESLGHALMLAASMCPDPRAVLREFTELLAARANDMPAFVADGRFADTGLGG